MFIETLEFTIPVDLCDLFSTMKRGPQSNMEFPASVNSYGTTQDANIQVLLKSNKLTFKVEGVSSDASMISKSECKTLKLSIFDVDRSLMPQDNLEYVEMPVMNSPVPVSGPAKRSRDFSASVRSPPIKTSRTTFSESSRGSTPVRQHQNQNNSHSSQTQSRHSSSDNSLNVKQEPEDPDLIEIEPDPEPDDVIPKREAPFMQSDYSSCSSHVPHTQTSQAALDRLSHPQSSHSQSPASSSSSFHQNVPHVPDYSEPGPSRGHHHGDQSADDFLVFQEQDDNEDCDNDNEADFDNDGDTFSNTLPVFFPTTPDSAAYVWTATGVKRKYPCPVCGRVFLKQSAMKYHKESIHDGAVFKCLCGKTYKYRPGLTRHARDCAILGAATAEQGLASGASILPDTVKKESG